MNFWPLSGRWDVQSEFSNVHWAARAFVTQDNSPLHCLREFAIRLCPFLLSLAKLSILFFCRQVHLGVGVHPCYEAVKRTLILCKLRLVCWTVALGDWALREQVFPRGRLHSIFSSAPLLCTAYWITALYHHICPTIEKLSQGHHELSRAISH